jgi:hypothetical protein
LSPWNTPTLEENTSESEILSSLTLNSILPYMDFSTDKKCPPTPASTTLNERVGGKTESSAFLRSIKQAYTIFDLFKYLSKIVFDLKI